MTTPKLDIDALVEEVSRCKGCKVNYVSVPEAVEFIAKVVEKKSKGEDPNLERASEILMEQWGIDIPRRALSDHARGKCSCRKRK